MSNPGIASRIGKAAAVCLAAALMAGCSMYTGQVARESITFKDQPEILQADLYLPREHEGNLPAVVVVHGGGWVRRSGDMQSISMQLAEEGFAAFNITYRSAINYPYPAAVDDVSTAINWLRENAASYQIDTDRIGGWGYSAGGHLILRAGLDPSVGLSAIVSGGTPAKFSYWPQSPIITRFIGATYQEAPEVWEDASPINHIQPDSPAIFMYHGENDTLVDPEQMALMSDALANQEVHVTTHLVENKGHFGTYLFGGEAEQQAIQFLKQWL